MSVSLLGRRTSGVLCHITSLPRDHDRAAAHIGDLGPTSHRFVDFLVDAGQTVWQMLPLCPPARNHSPYSCYSALAGNPLMISPTLLVSDGLLTDGDLDSDSDGDCDEGGPVDRVNFDRVNFERATAEKSRLLKLALARFQESACTELHDDFEKFQTAASHWLQDFARYEALMQKTGQIDWSDWPSEIALRSDDAIAKVDEELAGPIAQSKFTQFIFDRQWSELRRYANDRGVLLCGDMPIFVAQESADVWANQSLFCLDEQGKPAKVAGVPPDYFSSTGQLWGNPHYDWQALAETDYRWWTDRFVRTLQQFDLLRVDHFRAFEAYWEIPAGATSAVGGHWVRGPGEAPFRAAEKELGKMLIIAEDLGLITDEVYELRDALEFPGMRVMQFGFSTREDNYHRPDAFPAHSVAYTGTHDNETVMSWYYSQIENPVFQDLIRPYVSSQENIHLQLIRAVLASQAETALIPIQDLLALGDEGKMNTPGEATGNWAWRLAPEQLTATHAVQLKWVTRETGRAE